MAENLKYYSNKQEKLIADYLGWKQVVGSGARPFNVGDAVGDIWLGECKTHISKQNKIAFKRKVWDKLKREAMSCNRYAVYFVDNGTQTIKDTWCMISTSVNPFDIDGSLILDNRYVLDTGNISFNEDVLNDVDIYVAGEVTIMSLIKFAELYYS